MCLLQMWLICFWIVCCHGMVFLSRLLVIEILALYRIFGVHWWKFWVRSSPYRLPIIQRRMGSLRECTGRLSRYCAAIPPLSSVIGICFYPLLSLQLTARVVRLLEKALLKLSLAGYLCYLWMLLFLQLLIVRWKVQLSFARAWLRLCVVYNNPYIRRLMTWLSMPIVVVAI